MTERAKNICNQLRDEPLLHLSLHSKELFHSNVIAWFCETFPESARNVLSKWVPNRNTTTHRVQREKQNLDLSIEIPGLAPAIIENKVFSPPDTAQLERYSEKFVKLENLENPTFLLLSLGNPNWSDSTFVSSSGPVWRYISYRDLAEALVENIQGLNGFSGDVLRHYATFISLISDLVDELAHPELHEPIDLSPSARELLEPIRLHSAIEKFRYQASRAVIEREMTSSVAAVNPKFDSNFTTGTPLIEAFVRCGNEDEVGWQYQNNSWRLAVKTKLHSGVSADLKVLRHQLVEKQYIGWFNFSPIQDLIGRDVSDVPKNELKGGFNSYAPDFTYRHRELPALTLSELITLSRHYLAEAKKWI